MSYILDALRRADSERERGAIPSLHAKPVPAALADGDDEGEGRRPQPLLWAVIVLSVILLAVIAWLFMGRGGEPEAAPVTATAPAEPVVAALPPPPPSPAAPVPEALPAPSLLDPKPPVLPSAQPAQRSAPAKAASKAPAAASAVEERPTLAFHELPESIRRELPQLVIGGAMYSQTPANRMLILNGQVFREGEKVAAQLVLEQIRLKSAVLAYKGYRYHINY
jgi:general secretion pathway protein B